MHPDTQMLCPSGIWAVCIILLIQFTLILQLVIVFCSVLHAGLRSRVASVFGSMSRRGEIGFAILFSFLLLLLQKKKSLGLFISLFH